MGDHSRLALCAFMIGLIAFNPFNILFGSIAPEADIEYSRKVEHRRILGDDGYSKCTLTFRRIEPILMMFNEPIAYQTT